MPNVHAIAACLLAAGPALAQLPAPTLISRTTPRAAWTVVATAGATTSGTLSGGAYPATPNTTFRCDNPGAASFDKLWVFGGSLANNTATTANDLWAFDAVAGTFTQVIADGAAGSPSHRARSAIAWNPVANKLVLFGGNTRGGSTGAGTPTLLADTWEYDPIGNSWTNVTPAGQSPAPRQHAAMAWDPLLQGMLLFGGQLNDTNPQVLSNETWLFTGGGWTQLAPATVPPARTQHSLVTRSNFQDVVLCLGLDHASAAPDQIRWLDVWRWNGSDWALLSNYDVITNTGTSWPASTNGNQAVYDPLRSRIVVQGGNGITVAANTIFNYGPSYGGSPTNYTSEFDCITNTWSIHANPTTGTTPFNNTDPVIGRVSRYAAGFLAATGKVYKAGGQDPTKSGSRPLNNVYQYQADPVATATSYGAGCAGPGGTLSLTANGLPWTNRTWTGTCTTTGPTSLTLAVWGATTSSLPLAAVLPIAGPGCLLLNSADALLGPDVPVGGAVTVALPVPNNPALAGFQLHVQVAELAFDPTFQWTGLFTSNGITLGLGVL